MAHAAASAAAPLSSGSPWNSRTASRPFFAACTRVRADPAPSAGSARVACWLMWRRADRRQVGSGDDQAGLAEQLGRPHGQQPFVAGARPDQRDPPGRLLFRLGPAVPAACR